MSDKNTLIQSFDKLARSAAQAAGQLTNFIEAWTTPRKREADVFRRTGQSVLENFSIIETTDGGVTCHRKSVSLPEGKGTP